MYPANAKSEDAKPESTPGWRRIIKSMGLHWFSVPMGTGITGLVLAAIPWQGAWLYWIAVAFLCLNAFIFTVALTITALRYILFPEMWNTMLDDPRQSPYLGAMPIAFATLIEAWIFLCVPYWGSWATMVAWICWMLDAVISITTTVGSSYLLASQSNLHELTQITAAHILPISATLVAAGTAAECAANLQNVDHAAGTIIIGYLLWSLAVPMALLTLTMYYHRLALHKYPPPELIISSFIPLGPLGMGGFTILILGKAARNVLPNVVLLHHVPEAPENLYLLGIVTALAMWGSGMLWFGLAVAGLVRACPLSFNMTWWGFTFPIGVFALNTMTLGVELPSMFFRVSGVILTVSVVLLWLIVFYRTAGHAWSGRMFNV